MCFVFLLFFYNFFYFSGNPANCLIRRFSSVRHASCKSSALVRNCINWPRGLHTQSKANNKDGFPHDNFTDHGRDDIFVLSIEAKREAISCECGANGDEDEGCQHVPRVPLHDEHHAR